MKYNDKWDSGYAVGFITGMSLTTILFFVLGEVLR